MCVFNSKFRVSNGYVNTAGFGKQKSNTGIFQYERHS